jgi:hypothetical protein
MPRKIFAATALLAMASSAAMAESVSFSHTTVSQATPFTDTFSLPNFDASLGTLNSVAIDLAYTTTGEVDIDNATGALQTFTDAYSSTPLTVSVPDILPVTINARAGPIDGVADPGANPFPGLTGSGTLFITFSGSDLSAFETPPSGSTDTYSVEADLGSYHGSSVAGVFFDGSAAAGGVTTVTYDYTPGASSTPEPATIVLLGGALAGLGLLNKRLGKS